MREFDGIIENLIEKSCLKGIFIQCQLISQLEIFIERVGAKDFLNFIFGDWMSVVRKLCLKQYPNKNIS